MIRLIIHIDSPWIQQQEIFRRGSMCLLVLFNVFVPGSGCIHRCSNRCYPKKMSANCLPGATYYKVCRVSLRYIVTALAGFKDPERRVISIVNISLTRVV